MPLLCLEKKEEQLLLFSQQLQATWKEDGEQNEQKGNGRFDCCQVAATAWCFLFNTLLKFDLELQLNNRKELKKKFK